MTDIKLKAGAILNTKKVAEKTLSGFKKGTDFNESNLLPLQSRRCLVYDFCFCF